MYESIGGKINDFALPGMYNYTFAILNELQKDNYNKFKEKRLNYYSKQSKKILKLENKDKRLLFKQLFFAYKLMNNIRLVSKLSDDEKIPFIQLTTIAFYYSTYSLANCFIFCHDKRISTTHAKTYKNFNDFCGELAFPFNVTGRCTNGSCSAFEIIQGKDMFQKGFIYDSDSLKRRGLDSFDLKSAIYSYLKGTHTWYWENSTQQKEALKEIKKLDLENFKTKAARKVREKHFKTLPDVNFLNCLYRIRGKVNYRDSLFSLYNLKPKNEFKHYEKAIRLPNIMLEILKYFSIDIESFIKIRLGCDNFHENMLNNLIFKTERFNLEFPFFQKELFYN